MRFGGRVCMVVLAYFLVYATLALAATGPDPAYSQYQQCAIECQQKFQSERIRRQCRQSCLEWKCEEENPYVFEDQHFTKKLETQFGSLRILQNFTQRSNLLAGIRNYRVAVLEVAPQSFVVPNHWDAHALLYVSQGKGTVSLVSENNRNSFNVQEGDIIRVSAGTTTYLINTDSNQNLIITKLVRPVATPGEFEEFFGAGGEKPPSYYRAFSDEILDAALNTTKENWQKLFQQQWQGTFLKATKEQISAMKRLDFWFFRCPLNIFNRRPSQSNQYGQLYEVDSSQHKELQGFGVGTVAVAISLVKINQSAMMAPYYNSEATQIAIVDDGEGYFEMACPHLSQQCLQPGAQLEPEKGPYYKKLRSPLKRGTVVVIPPGHPFVAVATNNQNLQLLCFEVNAENNHRYPLAGRRNMIKQYEKEAKELAFGASAREVDEVFGSQTEEFFFKGPRQQPKGYAYA